MPPPIAGHDRFYAVIVPVGIRNSNTGLAGQHQSFTHNGATAYYAWVANAGLFNRTPTARPRCSPTRWSRHAPTPTWTRVTTAFSCRARTPMAPRSPTTRSATPATTGSRPSLLNGRVLLSPELLEQGRQHLRPALDAQTCSARQPQFHPGELGHGRQLRVARPAWERDPRVLSRQ